MSGDVLWWHLATVWTNIDRERASPSKRQLKYSTFRLKKQEIIPKSTHPAKPPQNGGFLDFWARMWYGGDATLAHFEKSAAEFDEKVIE